jgi:hypothetical protein
MAIIADGRTMANPKGKGFTAEGAEYAEKTKRREEERLEEQRSEYLVLFSLSLLVLSSPRSLRPLR